MSSYSAGFRVGRGAGRRLSIVAGSPLPVNLSIPETRKLRSVTVSVCSFTVASSFYCCLCGQRQPYWLHTGRSGRAVRMLSSIRCVPRSPLDRLWKSLPPFTSKSSPFGVRTNIQIWSWGNRPPTPRLFYRRLHICKYGPRLAFWWIGWGRVIFLCIYLSFEFTCNPCFRNTACFLIFLILGTHCTIPRYCVDGPMWNHHMWWFCWLMSHSKKSLSVALIIKKNPCQPVWVTRTERHDRPSTTSWKKVGIK